MASMLPICNGASLVRFFKWKYKIWYKFTPCPVLNDSCCKVFGKWTMDLPHCIRHFRWLGVRWDVWISANACDEYPMFLNESVETECRINKHYANEAGCTTNRLLVGTGCLISWLFIIATNAWWIGGRIHTFYVTKMLEDLIQHTKANSAATAEFT